MSRKNGYYFKGLTMSFNDKTYCASPNCKNKCGRKISPEEKEKLVRSGSWVRVSQAYFCDVPPKHDHKEKQPNA